MKTRDVSFLVTCILSSACASVRTYPLRLPDSKIYGEASIGTTWTMIGVTSTSVSEKQRTFSDPNYGNVVVENDMPFSVMGDADFTYSLGNDALRLEGGVALVWPPYDRSSTVTGFNEKPWDIQYITYLDPKRFVDTFIGFGTKFGRRFDNDRRPGYLMVAVGRPKTHFDWKRYTCNQVHIPGYEFSCGSPDSWGGDKQGISARVRFTWADEEGISLGVAYEGYFFRPEMAGEKMRYNTHVLSLLFWPR